MTWSDIGELIKAIAAVATALAAWFAASVAYRGLEKWRTETLGKRKAELAANVLAAVYEFEETIRSAREPWVQPHEMMKREGIPDEIAQNANYVPEARLLAHQAFFCPLEIDETRICCSVRARVRQNIRRAMASSVGYQSCS